MQTWTIGELAAVTGLTVRALRHYDEIGLARPSQRSTAGYRRYTPHDLQRLHRIVALRGFGFSLSEIGRLLDSAAPDPRAVIRSQLDQAQDRARQAARLRDRLAVVLELFDAAGDPSAATLVHLIEELVGMENSYTAEEFERMAAHRRELMAQLAPEQLEQMSAHRAALRAGLTPEQLAELQRSRPPMPR